MMLDDSAFGHLNKSTCTGESNDTLFLLFALRLSGRELASFPNQLSPRLSQTFVKPEFTLHTVVYNLWS